MDIFTIKLQDWSRQKNNLISVFSDFLHRITLEIKLAKSIHSLKQGTDLVFEVLNQVILQV